MIKLLFFASIAQIYLSVADSEESLAGLIRREQYGLDGYIEVCQQAPIDLAIILDASSSISREDFKTGIKFLQDFLQFFDLGSDEEGVRVSIITYGYGIYPEDGFNLTTYTKKDEVIAAVGRIPHRLGTRTDTGLAIKYMYQVQMSELATRPYAEKIAIVITDGNSQNARYTKDMAAAARQAGITMFAIGVGKVKDTELLNIAGDMSRVTKVETYDQLATIKKTLQSRTCIRKERPTTTPPPRTQSCGELEPHDVYFVFSRADLGPEASRWATAFISNTISTDDLDVGFRYGVVTGSCPDDAGFDLDTYNTIDDYKNRLYDMEDNSLPKLVQHVIRDGYSASSGGRQGATKVAVLVTSGDGKENLQARVDQLTANGIKVYIADPTKSQVEVNGAMTLRGSSSRQQSEVLASLLCRQ